MSQRVADIACVCFDLGGVVVRICRSFEEAALAAGVELRPLPSDPARDRRLHELTARHQAGEVDGTRFQQLLSAGFGGLYSPAELGRIHEAVLQGEYAGMAELIAALGASGLATACLSNTNESHWRILVGLPSLRSMHHRHASHLWGLVKPDPAIFRRFETERSLRGPQILYFDDLAENVEAALAAGWDAVEIDPAGDTAAQVGQTLVARGIRIA